MAGLCHFERSEKSRFSVFLNIYFTLRGEWLLFIKKSPRKLSPGALVCDFPHCSLRLRAALIRIHAQAS